MTSVTLYSHEIEVGLEFFSFTEKINSTFVPQEIDSENICRKTSYEIKICNIKMVLKTGRFFFFKVATKQSQRSCVPKGVCRKTNLYALASLTTPL